jgi:hypothetical protein
MRNLVLTALLASTASFLSAGIIATPEAPGVTSTTTPGVITVNFNGLTPGAFSGVTPIGTYSAGGVIVPADQYSGNGTSYISDGAQSTTTSYTLTFNSPQTFFGMLWDAMDAQNSLTFNTNGGPITFNSTNISGLVNADKGNPLNGDDSGEYFVYLDFTGTNGTTFSSVTFNNNGTGTGFESDNHSILASTVPEPSTYGMLLSGLGALGFAVRRRNARKA